MNSVKLDVLMISFINNMNERGHKIDPYGTPHVTGRISDIQLSNETYCLRLFR